MTNEKVENGDETVIEKVFEKVFEKVWSGGKANLIWFDFFSIDKTNSEFPIFDETVFPPKIEILIGPWYGGPMAQGSATR